MIHPKMIGYNNIPYSDLKTQSINFSVYFFFNQQQPTCIFSLQFIALGVSAPTTKIYTTLFGETNLLKLFNIYDESCFQKFIGDKRQVTASLSFSKSLSGSSLIIKHSTNNKQFQGINSHPIFDQNSILVLKSMALIVKCNTFNYIEIYKSYSTKS